MKNSILFALLFVGIPTFAQKTVSHSGNLNPASIPISEETDTVSPAPFSKIAPMHDSEAVMMEEPATPANGTASFQLYLARNTIYPMVAKVNGITGRVAYQFEVDTTGRINNVVILKDIGGGCGNMVKQTIENYPDAWIPAKYKGKKVKTFYTGTFNFALEGQRAKKHKKKKHK